MSDSEEEEVQSRTVKITVVGEPGTGKSSLCGRYLSYSVGGSTAGAAVLAGQCVGLRPPVPLQLCDVAGNARDSAMLDNYLYASDVVLFVYDLTNLHSFEMLQNWFDKVKEIMESEEKRPIMALFGNKSDLEHQRAVRLSVVQKFASEHLLENFKGSARTGDMVNTAFTNMVVRVVGSKARLMPAATNGKSPVARDPEVNSQMPLEPTGSLIMNRKALRRIQRKASSSVCCLQ